MKDLTMTLNLYRECVRNLWNVSFLNKVSSENKWDIAEQFDDICTSLFSSLVLNPNGRNADKKSASYTADQKPLAFLRVIPSSDSGVQIHINREAKSCGYWDYPIKTIKPVDADLRFVDYFDFDHLGFRDFQYCRVRIVASEKFPEIIGRDALIESNNITLELVE